MSLSNFIPQLWSDTLLAALRRNLVFGDLYNDDYQGEISQYGDTVRINAIGDITVSSYTKDTDLAAAASLVDAQTMLTISQAKYYNFEIDDVDMAQAHPTVMAEAMSWAAYKVALTMDQYFRDFYTDAPSTNNVGTSSSFTTPTAPTLTSTGVGSGTTVFDYLIILNQNLTQQAVPKTGRWCVVPPWVTTYLMLDPRFSGYNTDAGRAAIKAGKLDVAGGNDAYIGQVFGCDVYESLNAKNLGGTPGTAGSQDVILMGHKMAVTKAIGLVKTEAYRPPLRFADAVKGLSLYGAKTVRPYALAAAFLQHP